MAAVGGTYHFTTRTPLGPQEGTTIIIPGEGDSFSGSMEMLTGKFEFTDGTASPDGKEFQFKVKVKMPMVGEPLLEVKGTIDGLIMKATAKAPFPIGTLNIEGTRVGD